MHVSYVGNCVALAEQRARYYLNSKQVSFYFPLVDSEVVTVRKLRDMPVHRSFSTLFLSKCLVGMISIGVWVEGTSTTMSMQIFERPVYPTRLETLPTFRPLNKHIGVGKLIRGGNSTVGFI